MKRAALDIDDVLAAFYPGFCKYLHIPEKRVNIWDGKGECKWIIDNMYKIKDDCMFWFNLDKLSNPESIDFDVACYLTSSPKEVVETRRCWLIANGYPEAPVVSTQDKLKYMQDQNIDILVDDKLSTIDHINSNGKIGLQFKPAYMTEEIDDKSKIIHHLSEVKKWLK